MLSGGYRVRNWVHVVLLLVTGTCLALLGACTTILGDFTMGPGPATGGAGGSVSTAGGAGGIAGDCGNGSIEGAEACDDGNSDNNDGCSTTCVAEWTCQLPGELVLSKPGAVYKGTLSGSTEGGEDQVGEASCDGGAKGGKATDRSILFTMPVAGLDAFITLNSGFDGLLRASDDACDLGSSLGCMNSAAGADGTEFLHLSALDIGSYHVLVDGVSGSDSGAFTLDVVACESDPTTLFFEELHLGQTDFVVITNGGDCPVQLEGKRVFFDDRDDYQLGLEDCLTELPAYLLMPWASVKVSEDAVAGEISALPGLTSCGSGVPFNPGRGGTAYLCDGECLVSNVLDMVSFHGTSAPEKGGAPPEPIAGLNFDAPLTGVTGPSQQSKRYGRVAMKGSAPSFLASDWSLRSRMLFADFESGDFSGWAQGRGQPATFTTDLEAAVGTLSLKLVQGPNNGKSAGLTQDISGKPFYISFYARVSATDVNAGTVDILGGDLTPILFNFEPTGMGVERENNVRTEVPFLADTWYRIELRHINWPGREFDYYVDGVLIGRKVPFFANVNSMTSLQLYSVTANSVTWWDNIEMWD